MKVGPVTFLFAIAIGWALIRAAMLWPEDSPPHTPPTITWHPAANAAPSPPAALGQLFAAPALIARPLPVGTIHPARMAALPAGIIKPAEPTRTTPVEPPTQSAAAAAAPIPAQSSATQVARSRLSGSAWSIMRGSGPGGGLAAGGQLGGSQAGIRLRYDLGAGVALAARLSGARLNKEASVALDWRPLASIPVTFALERRVGLDRGGRDAFGAGVFGGFDTALARTGITLDGYAQAGLVGLRRRDAYMDGALRIEQRIANRGRSRIGIGAGIWGGAQPGVARLDIGPQLVAHVPIGPAQIRIGAEWRERIAGQAGPGSGPALSVGTDF